MNRERRRRIDGAMDMLDAAKEVVDQAQMEEEGAYDNLPEGLQCGARGKRRRALAKGAPRLPSKASCVGAV